jgi:uncharacterized membrane protein
MTGQDLVEPTAEPEATALPARPSSASGLRIEEAVAPVRSLLSRVDSLRLEYLYLAVALLWGIGLVVLMPPFQVPDEPAHFYRAWGLAQGQILPPRNYREILPANVWSLREAFPVGVIGVPSRYPGYDPGKVKRLLGERIASRKVSAVTAIPSQNPLAYVPQALGIELARVTGFSPLGSFYLARLLNLLTAVALVFFAIRLLPFGKVMLLIVALFPVTISEMASTSPDALAIAGAFFFTGLLLNLSQRATVKDSQMVAVLLSALLLLAVKPGYFPMVGLLFLIKPASLTSARRYAAWISCTIGAVLLVAALTVLTAPAAPANLPIAVGPVVPGADSVAQLKLVLTDPLGFGGTMFKTLGSAGITYGYWMIGLLSWLSINISHSAVLLVLLLILCLIGGFEGEPPIRAWRRSVLLVTWVATTTSVTLAIYLTLNAVGNLTVDSLQGRYFTPMFPLLLLGLYRLQLKRRSSVTIILAVALGLIALTTMRAIWYHYY